MGQGAHLGPGEDHAEVVAIRAAGAEAAGATMYVTLEPCTHHGRTPPCVDAIIGARLSKVVVGTLDPDERVSGRGVERLTEAGIEVIELSEQDRARSIDSAYFHHRETGMPLVRLKYAITLDGSAAATDSTSQWITSSQAREDAHLLRAESDGVVIGAGTLRSDDPRLDIRLAGHEGFQPRPVIVAGEQPLPESARIWKREPIVISTSDRSIPSGRVVIVAGDGAHPDPTETCLALAEEGLLALLLEGGPNLAGSWVRAGVVSSASVYLGSKLGGGEGLQPLHGEFATIDEARIVSITSVRTLGPDVCIEFEF